MNELKKQKNTEIDSLNLMLNELKSSLAESSETLSKLENAKNDVSNKLSAAMGENARLKEECAGKV